VGYRGGEAVGSFLPQQKEKDENFSVLSKIDSNRV
jgi:hypothetical protein